MRSFIVFFLLINLICGFTLYRAQKPNHHSGSDSRNKSENVDLDETDGESFDRMRNVLGSMNPSFGLMHRIRWRERK
uniref:Neuropeptide n=1 Tax=Caenorhabditis tropicalis TaxID=1561998 RepID=A0A1I7UP14_9PELO